MYGLFLCLILFGPASAEEPAINLAHDLSLHSSILDTNKIEESLLRDDARPATIQERSSPDLSGSLSLEAFPKNLGRNFVGLFSTRNIAPLAAGLAVTGISSNFDRPVKEYFGQRNTDTFFSGAGADLGKSYVLAPAIGTLFLAGLHSSNERFHSFSYALAQGYVLTTGISHGLKEISGRQRPDGSNGMSFPSGHAADTFMIATVVDQYYGHKVGIFAYGIAGLVSASRLERNVHWLSDVAAGAALGYITGKTVSRNTLGMSHSRRVAIAPAIDPLQKAYGVAIQIRLP